jgi:putative endonuclease
MSGVCLNFPRKVNQNDQSQKVFFYTFATFVLGPVVQWIEYLPTGRQGSFLVFVTIMYFVYAIRSLVDGRIYVGMTNDVAKRLSEHNAGKTKSTKGYTPWQLIYTESLPLHTQARVREKYLKSGVGKEFLKAMAP